MANSNAVIRKRRGRPRTEEFPVVSFRLDPSWRQDIDDWRSGEPGNLSRSQAMRLLMMMGLSAAYDEREQTTRNEQAARKGAGSLARPQVIRSLAQFRRAWSYI